MKSKDGRTYDTLTMNMWLPEHYKYGDVVEYNGNTYEVLRVRGTGGFIARPSHKYYDVIGFCYLDEVLLGDSDG